MTNEEQRQVLKRRAYERCLRNLALRLAKAGLAEAELAAEIRTSGGVHPPTRRSRGHSIRERRAVALTTGCDAEIRECVAR